jgi:hypothetical protein
VGVDSTTKNESVTEVVPHALGKYLKENVSGLLEFYDEFPSTNRAFKTPSVSVITTSFEFAPCAHVYKESVGAITANKANVLWVVGDYEVKVQLDVWAGSKEERDDFFDAVFNALNPKISPMGLTLILNDYFGSLCDYLYVGHSFADSEERSQADEWRVTMTVLATCKALRDRKEFIITDPDTAQDIEDTSDIGTDVIVIE